jgi:hypothetical protein
MRLHTPCCGVPLAGRDIACLHEWERYRYGLPPHCWVGHRPRLLEQPLTLGLAA